MKSVVWPALSLLLVPSIFAQPKGYLYDEAKVPHYTLPDLLTTQKGQQLNVASYLHASNLHYTTIAFIVVFITESVSL